MNTYDDTAIDSGSGTVLSSWIKWLVIVLAICAVFLITAVNANEENGSELIGDGMYVIIILSAVGCIYRSFIDTKFLDTQMKAASEQVRILEEVDTIDEFLLKTQNSIFRAHIENLYTISKAHSEISQDNLIEILYGRLLAKNQVVEMFSSILITLGLIGTIVGLIFMMNDLTLVMKNSGESTNLLGELTKDGGPLSGLGVAFYTTLLGATLGGILLRLLTSVVDSSINRFIAHLAELTEVYVLPHLRAMANAKHASKLEGNQ